MFRPRNIYSVCDYGFDSPHRSLYDFNYPQPRVMHMVQSLPIQFQVKLNVKQFRPEEISIKTVDGFIVIHAKHEEKADEHGFVSREFTRKYPIPDDVQPETITSSLDGYGWLTIQAPRKTIIAPKNERIIPITVQQSAASEMQEKAQQPASPEEKTDLTVPNFKIYSQPTL